jgi:hypothetical protein
MPEMHRLTGNIIIMTLRISLSYHFYRDRDLRLKETYLHHSWRAYQEKSGEKLFTVDSKNAKHFEKLINLEDNQ